MKKDDKREGVLCKRVKYTIEKKLKLDLKVRKMEFLKIVLCVVLKKRFRNSEKK